MPWLRFKTNIFYTKARFHCLIFEVRVSQLPSIYTIIYHQNDATWALRLFDYLLYNLLTPLQWRHNERNVVSNHRRLHCLLSRLFRCRSKTASKLRVTGLCDGNSPVTDEFPAQRASDAENVSIWWHHHVMQKASPIPGFQYMGSLFYSDWPRCWAENQNPCLNTVVNYYVKTTSWRRFDAILTFLLRQMSVEIVSASAA